MRTYIARYIVRRLPSQINYAFLWKRSLNFITTAFKMLYQNRIITDIYGLINSTNSMRYYIHLIERFHLTDAILKKKLFIIWSDFDNHPLLFFFYFSLPTSPETGRVTMDVLFNGRNWNIFVTYLKQKKERKIYIILSSH